MTAAAPEKRVSRLAPSPTGALHLGNAFAFLCNWAIARQRNWRLCFRIEDLDGPRIKADASRQAIDILQWLGLDWDGEPIIQSDDLEPYRDAVVRLAAEQRIFRCDRSRKDIEDAASAPHAEGGETRYPPTLRPDPESDPSRWGFDAEDANYRFRTDPEAITIHDAVAGTITHNPGLEIGDFLVWTARSAPSYQLAVVVDDYRQGITDVVRGNDLLPSATRQELLYRALGWTPPRWWHLPLVRGTDGRRLAKRHGDTRIDHYRSLGVPPRAILGLLAHWCGILPEPQPIEISAFLDEFATDQLPGADIVFKEEHDRWLRSNAS